jgi:hypothetical protein
MIEAIKKLVTYWDGEIKRYRSHGMSKSDTYIAEDILSQFRELLADHQPYEYKVGDKILVEVEVEYIYERGSILTYNPRTMIPLPFFMKEDVHSLAKPRKEKNNWSEKR